MAKITKERAQRILNELTDLTKEVVAECGVFHYDSGEMIKAVNDARRMLKYACERIINKSPDYDQPVTEKKYESIELKKSEHFGNRDEATEVLGMLDSGLANLLRK